MVTQYELSKNQLGRLQRGECLQIVIPYPATDCDMVEYVEDALGIQRSWIKGVVRKKVVCNPTSREMLKGLGQMIGGIVPDGQTRDVTINVDAIVARICRRKITSSRCLHRQWPGGRVLSVPTHGEFLVIG